MKKRKINVFLDVWQSKKALRIVIFLIFLTGSVGVSRASLATEDKSVKSVNQVSNITVKGIVTDEEGEPIIGATIQVKKTSQGVVTDFDGKFSITVPVKSVLVISYMGYLTEEIIISGSKPVNVILKENTKQLDEVVVVGYGTQRKETMVGAVSSVNNETLMRSGTNSVTGALAGKLSGVLTIQGTGEPGRNNSEVIIRGLSSWNGSAPLVLIDGVERDYTDLDPAEINTISVLKDASATAVFGAKGANGVIIVTTKRGTKSKPKLKASFATGMQVATRIPDFIDSYTTMSLLNYAAMNDQRYDELRMDNVLNEYRNPSSRINSIRYPNVDWFDLVSRNFAPTANANVSVQGGTDFVRYFGSLGWTREGSFFHSYHKGYDDTRYKNNRFNYRVNLDFSLSKSTTLSMNVGGDVNIKNSPGSAPWAGLYAMSPSKTSAYYPAWLLKEVPDTDYPDASGIRFAKAPPGSIGGNPYSSLNNGSFKEVTGTKLFTDLILDQKLDKILKGLSLKGKASMSTYFQNTSLHASYSFPEYRLDFEKIGSNENPWYREGQTNDVFVQDPLNIQVGGLGGGYYQDLYFELGMNYKNTFGDHTVSGLLLGNRSKKKRETKFPYYNQGLVARTTYDYKHKYLAEFNMGYTGSERFSPENRYGFFPSYALGWVISEEPFFKKGLPWFNKLKIRYSDGMVGSDHAGNRWLYVSDYSGGGGAYIYEDKIANASVQWEEARKRDLGFEFGFFNSDLHFTVELFEEHREKMLLVPRNVTMLVGNSFKELNKGSLKKHGIETEVSFNKKVTPDFSYSFKAMVGYNENRVLFKDDLLYAPEYRKDAGKPLGVLTKGIQLAGKGYFSSVDDIHNSTLPVSPNKLIVGDYKYIDYNADGRLDNNDVYVVKGSKYAPITYSMNAGFRYKAFNFNMMFQGNYGKYISFSKAFETEFFRGDYRLHKSQLDYWTPINPDANHATLHYRGTQEDPNIQWAGGDAWSGYGGVVDGRGWRRADYLRLKEIYASYDFEPDFLKRKLGVSSLMLYGTANNVFTFTTLVEGDPESKDFNNGFYPIMASYQLGLKIAF